MHTHFMRALGAGVAAGTLTALGLAGVGSAGAAVASGSTAAGQAAVPASFQPVAASFSTPASGVVLGGVGCLPRQLCRARLAATADGGARWRYLTAPDVWLSAPAVASSSPQVSQVVFAGQRDGWVYNQYVSPVLWATHDGGAHWRQLSLGGDIRALEASAGTVYAVVSGPSGDELLRSPVGRNAWSRVGTMTGSSLAVSGKAAWFGASTYLWVTTDGVQWHKYPFRCPAGLTLAGIAPASSSHVAFLCDLGEGMFQTFKETLRSVNGGRTEFLTGQAPRPGDVYGFAAPPNRSMVLTIAAVTPGPDYLYRSGNGGRTWASITIPGTGSGLSVGSLSYVSRTVGWLVAGQVKASQQVPTDSLLRTSDAGLTWSLVRF